MMVYYIAIPERKIDESIRELFTQSGKLFTGKEKRDIFDYHPID